MAIRPIRLLGDPVLRTVADPVTDFDAEPRAVRAAPWAAADATPPR